MAFCFLVERRVRVIFRDEFHGIGKVVGNGDDHGLTVCRPDADAENWSCPPDSDWWNRAMSWSCFHKLGWFCPLSCRCPCLHFLARAGESMPQRHWSWSRTMRGISNQ